MRLPDAPARVAGRITWSLLDRDGNVVREGTQSNLILDQGIDEVFATYGPGVSDTTGIGRYLAVGTSSIEPTVTDTALGAELARTDASGGNNWTQERVSNGVYDLTWTRQFDFADANGVLTEWGVAPTASGNLFARELFRDETDNPVPITKTSDEQLRISYTLRVTLLPVTPTLGVMSITGLTPEARNGAYCWTNGFGSSEPNAMRDLPLFHDLVTGNPSAAISISDTAGSAGYNTTNGYATGASKPLVPHAYVPGSKQRSFAAAQWSSAEGNITVRRIQMRSSLPGYTYGGYMFQFDAVDGEFTKANTHRLSITPPAVTWDRG